MSGEAIFQLAAHGIGASKLPLQGQSSVKRLPLLGSRITNRFLMKQMKYIIWVLVLFLNINILYSQKKTYDNILKKVEANIEKNYYSDSIFAVRHSEYIIDDLTQDIKQIACIDYFQTPMWAVDGKFYKQRYGFDSSVFPLRTLGYLISAKLYKKDEENNCGFTIPHRFATSFSSIDINGQFHSVLSGFVSDKKRKRALINNNTPDTTPLSNMNMNSFGMNNNLDNQKSKISVEYGNVNNEGISKHEVASEKDPPKSISITTTPIYTTTEDSNMYTVDNVIYDGVDCYKLTKINKIKYAYEEFERQRLEGSLKSEMPHLNEQQIGEFKQHIEYWAGGKSSSATFIVTKKNFAVLLCEREVKHQNSQGEWFVAEKVMEKYQRNEKDKKYYQTSYTKFVRNYVGSFLNPNNFVTLVFRSPSPSKKNFSLNDTMVIPRKYKLRYEDFCERVDMPDDDMLLDWNKYKE